jgi:hypothetical protein
MTGRLLSSTALKTIRSISRTIGSISGEVETIGSISRETIGRAHVS